MARSLSYPLIALLALPLAAQAVDNSYPRVSMFYGTAPTIGTKGAFQVRESVQVGLEYSHPVWKGEVFGAVEWRDFRTLWRHVTRYSPRGEDGQVIQIEENKTGYATVKARHPLHDEGMPPQPVIGADGKPQIIRGFITPFIRHDGSWGLTLPSDHNIFIDNRFDSHHMSKSDLMGGTSKLAYRQYFKVPYIGQIGVHGGLTINFLTSAEYARGEIHVLSERTLLQNRFYTNWTSDDYDLDEWSGYIKGRLHNDRFFEDNKNIGILPGVFAGFRTFINDNFWFETNFTTLGYKAIEYVPFAYTGELAYNDKTQVYEATGKLEKTNRTKVVWEFNVGFRF